MRIGGRSTIIRTRPCIDGPGIPKGILRAECCRDFFSPRAGAAVRPLSTPTVLFLALVVSVEPIGDILSHFVVFGVGYLLAATFVDLCILSLHREIIWLERLFRFHWLSPAFDERGRRVGTAGTALLGGWKPGESRASHTFQV
jgi:hypothetical protein